MASQYVNGCKNKGRRGEKHLAGKDSLTPKDSTCHNVRSSTSDPSEVKFCKTDKENLT